MGSDCLDLFAKIGVPYNESNEKIIARFDRAWSENPELTVKILFFARDIQSGLDNQRAFRAILLHMADNMPSAARKNLWAVTEFGRYDDLMVLLDSPLSQDVIAFIKKHFNTDIKVLEGKSPVYFGGKFRRALTDLCARIAFIEKQPSTAMSRHQKIFSCGAVKNESPRHSDTVCPFDVIRPILSGYMTARARENADVTWNALEDFTHGENTLAVIDNSGSMYVYGEPRPAEVALSMGILFAERGKGEFAGNFVTFSGNPRLVKIEGEDIFSKVRYCAGFSEVSNIDIKAVFDLILSTAINSKPPLNELPSTLLIISDRRFDTCSDNADITCFKLANKAFTDRGYKLPQVVFWNVSNRDGQPPVMINDQSMVLISGSSPDVFSMIRSGALSQMAFMLEILNSERYSKLQV